MTNLSTNTLMEFLQYLTKTSNFYYIEQNSIASKEEVDALRELDRKGIEVYAFGLKSTYQGHLFEGSRRLFEVADELEELYGICLCGKKHLNINQLQSLLIE